MREPYDIIKTVRVTEKGTALAEKQNTYVLKVDRGANKPDIARAVEAIFKVTVLRVRTINVHGVSQRDRRTGWRHTSTSWKKALVTLKKGDKIEIGVT